MVERCPVHVHIMAVWFRATGAATVALGSLTVRHSRRAFSRRRKFGVSGMAVKEYPKSITVTRGPMATGRTKTGEPRFSFCAFANKKDKDGREIEGSGDIHVGESPVTIKLDGEDAKRIGLAKTVLSMVQKGYLTDVNAPPRKKLSDKGE